jgi:hypothetical protein
MALSGTATFLILPGLLALRGERAFWPWQARKSTWAARPQTELADQKEAI